MGKQTWLDNLLWQLASKWFRRFTDFLHRKDAPTMEKRGIVDSEHTPPEDDQPTKQPEKLAEHLTKRAADHVAETTEQIVKSAHRKP